MRPVDCADHSWRRDLVPGLLGAGLGQRPGGRQDQSGGGEWPVRHQRAEDLDELGALFRHDVPTVPHRAREAEAPGLELPAGADDRARHRGAPARDHDGARDLQRDLPHQRACPRRPDRHGARRRLARRQRHAQVRAASARRCQQADGTRRAHSRAHGAHEPGRPARHGHPRVPRPAAAPAGRGDGLQISRPAAADRAGARRGLRASSA